MKIFKLNESKYIIFKVVQNNTRSGQNKKLIIKSMTFLKFGVHL